MVKVKKGRPKIKELDFIKAFRYINISTAGIEIVIYDGRPDYTHGFGDDIIKALKNLKVRCKEQGIRLII